MSYPLSNFGGWLGLRGGGEAALFLAEFLLSTLASDSNSWSHKTGGGSVVAVTNG